MRIGFATLTAVAVVLACSGAAMAQEVALRGAAFVPLNSTFGIPAKAFADELNKRGAGKVKLTMSGPEVMSGFEMGNAVKSGVLDIAVLPAAYYKSLVPEGDVITISEQGPPALRQNGGWEMLNKLHNEKGNMHYVTYFGHGVPFHIYLSKPVAKIEDFKNIKLRTAPNYQSFFKTIGATTVTTAPPEVLTALERGTVDGYGWPITGIFDMGWGPATKYRVDPGFWNATVNIVMNKDKWDGLSADQKKAFNDTIAWFESDYYKTLIEKTVTEAKRQDEAGIKVIKLPAELEEIAVKAYMSELEALSPDNIKKLRPLVAGK